MDAAQAGIHAPPILAVAGLEIEMLVVRVDRQRAVAELRQGREQALDVAGERHVPVQIKLVADQHLAAWTVGHRRRPARAGDAVAAKPHPASVDVAEEALAFGHLGVGR